MVNFKSILAGCILLFSSFYAWADTSVYEINSGWKFQRVSKDVSSWHPATVPGCVQADLLAIGEIEDPYFRMNERNIQWVDKEDWKYRTVFDVSSDVFSKDNIFICFEGLDTFADVVLNGKTVLSSDNMFRIYRADVKDVLKQEGNVLEVYFHSITKKGLELREKSLYRFPAMNDLSQIGGLFDKKISMYMRKAPYHFGWDWGPRIITMGIWKPISLVGWNDARIEDTHYVTTEIKSKEAALAVKVNVLADKEIKHAELVISNNGKVYSRRLVALEKGKNQVKASFVVKNPRLWWCNGMGDPNLYDFKAEVIANGEVISERIDKIGIRTIRLEQEKDQWGRSFRFILNGVPVFAKGVNVIPFDNILTNVNSETYRRHLEPAAEVGMNMIRVWGGGIYETDDFYRQCDSLGLMVWQDFIFACTMYPSEGELLSTMKEEFEDNIRRIRNHPSIALWCGSNELEYSWASKSLKKRNSPEKMEAIWKMYLDQNEAIVSALDTLCPEISYQPSSPFRGYGKGKSHYEGDYHTWAVLTGSKPIEYLEECRARFFSEYGYESFDHYESVVKYAPRKEDQSIYSDVMLWHQRQGYNAVRANGNIVRYTCDNYPAPKSFKDTLYASQVLQADVVKLAVEAHRRDKGFCWGSLYWQLNNCWPVSSDSSIDYEGNWKGLHYMVRRVFEPKIVSGRIYNDTLQVYVVTDELKADKGVLNVEVVGMDGKILSSSSVKVSVPSNSSKMIYQAPVKDILKGADAADAYVRFVYTDSEGNEHSNLRFFCNQKDVRFLDHDIKATVKEVGDYKEVTLISNVFTRAVYVSVKDSELLHFSDNFFDLHPGESYTIKVKTDLPSEELKNRLQYNTVNKFLY